MVKSTRKRHSRKHGKGDTRRLFVRRAKDMPSQLAVLREAVSSFGHLAPHSMKRAARTALRGPGEYAVLGKDGSPRGHLKTFEDAWDLARDGDVRADSDPTHSEPEYGVFKAEMRTDKQRRKQGERRRKLREEEAAKRGEKWRGYTGPNLGGAPPLVSARDSRSDLRRREQRQDYLVVGPDGLYHPLVGATQSEMEQVRAAPADKEAKSRRRRIPVLVKNPDSDEDLQLGVEVSKGGKGSAMREASRLRRDLGPSRGTKRRRSPSPEKRHTRRRHSDSLTAAMKRLQVGG